MRRPPPAARTALLSVVAAWLLLSGCGTSTPDHQGGGAVLLESHDERMRTPGWLEFVDLSLHPASETRAPAEPYVRGYIVGGLFFPTGDVVGPRERPEGRRVLVRGWLDLRTRAFHHADGATPRRAPYVEGLRDEESGAFFPTHGIVHDDAAGS